MTDTPQPRAYPETFFIRARDNQYWDSGDFKWGKAIVLGLLALVSIILMFRSFTRVGTGEIAVMTRFGRVTGQELGEGIHPKNPLDKANKYDIKVQKTEAKAAAASKDLQDVNATVVLNFDLAPGSVSEIHQKVGTLYPEKLIDPAIQEVFKASTARFDATRLITERASVKQQAVLLLRDRLDDFGIRVIDLSITNFSFSKDFTSAIESKQVAQQEAERARFRLEAARTEAEAQEVQARTLSRLFLQKLFLDKWDGKLPRVMGSDDMGFLLDLREEGQ